MKNTDIETHLPSIHEDTKHCKKDQWKAKEDAGGCFEDVQCFLCRKNQRKGVSCKQSKTSGGVRVISQTSGGFVKKLKPEGVLV